MNSNIISTSRAVMMQISIRISMIMKYFVTNHALEKRKITVGVIFSWQMAVERQ